MAIIISRNRKDFPKR